MPGEGDWEGGGAREARERNVRRLMSYPHLGHWMGRMVTFWSIFGFDKCSRGRRLGGRRSEGGQEAERTQVDELSAPRVLDGAYGCILEHFGF